MLLFLAVLSALAGPPPPSTEAPPRARAHTLVGTVLRVDAKRHVVTLGPKGEPPVERDVVIEESTRLIADGRAIGLEDVRIGARAVVVCEDDARGTHHARIVKAGAARHAAPEPSTEP